MRKEAGKPVYELLGGPVKTEIPCYVSNLHSVSHETLEQKALDYAERGFGEITGDAYMGWNCGTQRRW